jgi:hypothetical protein
MRVYYLQYLKIIRGLTELPCMAIVATGPGTLQKSEFFFSKAMVFLHLFKPIKNFIKPITLFC